jgi:hypothetical protein
VQVERECVRKRHDVQVSAGSPVGPDLHLSHHALYAPVLISSLLQHVQLCTPPEVRVVAAARSARADAPSRDAKTRASALSQALKADEPWAREVEMQRKECV